MRDVVLCDPVRTPIGDYGGLLRDVSATDLAATVIRALTERVDLDPAEVDDVILGQCYPNGEAPAIGRVAALEAGLPVEIPGMQLDRRCGSGLQAICEAAMQIQTGVADLIIAGGAESMSQAEHYVTGLRWGSVSGDLTLHDRLVRGRVTAGSSKYPVPGGMIETAENIRAQYGISRQEQDEYALESHRRAVAAQRSGRFADEIVPVAVSGRRAVARTVDVDEHPRPDTDLEKLSRLRPVRATVDSDATVTAGNASGQNDAAAACFVTTSTIAERLGLHPMGRLLGWAAAGVPPSLMGLGPVPAVDRLLGRLNLTLRDMDLIELNEAFAAQVLGVLREWDTDESLIERLNVNGSGISLGHPVGATGARIMATLLHEMRRRGSELGLETMCIGGGQGIAAVVRAA